MSTLTSARYPLSWSPELRPCSGPDPARVALSPAPVFILFLILNAALLIRPAEIIPALLGWHIYLTLILLCVAVALPNVLDQFRAGNLATRPITVCVLGFLLMGLLSHLSWFHFEGVATSWFEYAKLGVYYLLLVSFVTSTERLRILLSSLAVFALVLTVVAVLQYHGVISVINLSVLKDTQIDPITGRELVIPRLRGTGAFFDPNDLSLVLVFGLLVSFDRLADGRVGALRLFWLAALVVFGYALALTQSRGGFLCLLVGLSVYLAVRFGLGRSLILGAVIVPLVFLFFAGRQTSLSATGSTSQTRIQLWSDGLMLFKTSPVFGIGTDLYEKEAGQVAHNSYLHSFTETGFVGGMFFLGAVYLALWSLYRLGSGRRWFLDPDLGRMHPLLIGIVAAYATGMLSLSVGPVVLTYTILGLAAAYVHMAAVYPPLSPPVFSGRLVGQLAGISVLFLASLYIFVRVFLRWA
jgi:O-antigen ligase